MNDTLLWYTTRGAGAVSLMLLSTVTALGFLSSARVEGRAWPRFLTPALHRDLALVGLVFLGLHIVTAVVDPYTHLGITAATVPFGSYYRTFWLGLGTIAFELLVAVVATSLLRQVIGARTWRAVHWSSYAAWPVAVFHGLGTGTDAFSLWLLGITTLCVAGVVVAAAYRWMYGRRDPLLNDRRTARAAASIGAGR